MASTLIDLAIMTPSSAFGTSAIIPLGSAASVSGVTYLSFAGAGATGGQQVSYSILDTGNSEIGTATYLSSNATLTTRTPTKSTNGGAAINASSAALILGTVRGEDLNSFITAGQLLGTATNDSATAGNVGEYLSGVSGATGYASGVLANMTSIAITPGDWNVSAYIKVTPSSSCIVVLSTVSLSTTSATLDTVSDDRTGIPSLPGAGAQFLGDSFSVNAGPSRFLSSGTTTVFMVFGPNFTSGTVSAKGILTARRAR